VKRQRGGGGVWGLPRFCFGFAPSIVLEVLCFCVLDHISTSVAPAASEKPVKVPPLYDRLDPGGLREAPPPPALMKPSQVVCAGCRSEDSPSQCGCSFPRRELPAPCLLSLRSQRPHSPQAPRREGARRMKVRGPRGGRRYFETKCLCGMCEQARGCLDAFIYLPFFSFCKSRSHSSQIATWFVSRKIR